MIAVITHYYNEEYLLPWWLSYHKKIFDHGILIDYGSTDKSNEIIKTICPTWDIVPTKNQYFDAHPCDDEVKEYEKHICEYKIALNLTEFLIGNIDDLLYQNSEEYHLKSYIMTDPTANIPANPHYNDYLFNQCHHGYFDMSYRQSRILHRKEFYPYTAGRHSREITTEKACILWYGLSPWNEETIKRKLQIQHKISAASMDAGFGPHHRTNREKLNELYKNCASQTQNLKDMIGNLLNFRK